MGRLLRTRTGGASARTSSRKKVAPGLVALSTAAILAVYSAGYARTRSAAERFEHEDRGPRPGIPSAPDLPAPARPIAERPAVAPMPVRPAAADLVVRPQNERRAAATAPATPTPVAAAGSASVERARSVASTPTVARTAVVELPPSQPAVAVSAAPAVSAPVSSSVAAAPASAPVPAQSAAAVMLTPPPVDPAPQDPPAPVLKDGTYSGWGSSRHGDIEATVVIQSGRVVSAAITQCRTRYSCSWIAALPGQVVSRQSAEVDYVSGATQSTNAFYYAIVEALSKAR